jgi:hypothetical protein
MIRPIDRNSFQEIDLRSGLYKICMAEQNNDIALQWLRCRIAAQNQQKEGQ